MESLIINWPIIEEGLTLYGSLPPNIESKLSASAIVLLIGVGSEPLAMLSLAAINCLARIRLASPLLGVPKMFSNSVLIYVWLPSIRLFTGQALG